MIGGVVFGFGKRKKQQQAIAIVSAALEPIYNVHFGRSQPANLARVVVEQSFNGETPKFAGRSLGAVGPIVQAIEALRAGFLYLDVGEQAQTACAAALGLALRRASAPANFAALSPMDQEYLEVSASTLQSDQSWQAAMSRLPEGTPVAQTTRSA